MRDSNLTVPKKVHGPFPATKCCIVHQSVASPLFYGATPKPVDNFMSNINGIGQRPVIYIMSNREVSV